jgi:hypothetical protein
MLAALAVAFVLVSSQACGSPGGAAPEVRDAGAETGEAKTTPFSIAAMRGAADAFNAKYCPAFEKCDPQLFAFTFGATEKCRDAGGLVATASGNAGEGRYVNDLAAPYAFGSLLTPDALRACASALDLSTCEAWVRFMSEREGETLDACRPAFFGKILEGASCGVWNQCASGRCLQPGNAPPGSCGVCVAQKSVGARCEPNACVPGATCRRESRANRDTLICRRYADDGGDCEPNDPGELTVLSTPRPCRDYLVCNGSTKKCELPPANDACDANIGCSFVPSLRYCKTSKCEPLPFAPVGALCGYDVPDAPINLVTCAHGYTCTGDAAELDAAAPAGRVNHCTSLIEDGDACIGPPDQDRHCKQPDSRCFHNICQKNGAAECTAPRALP